MYVYAMQYGSSKEEIETLRQTKKMYFMSIHINLAILNLQYFGTLIYLQRLLIANGKYSINTQVSLKGTFFQIASLPYLPPHHSEFYHFGNLLLKLFPFFFFFFFKSLCIYFLERQRQYNQRRGRERERRQRIPNWLCSASEEPNEGAQTHSTTKS